MAGTVEMRFTPVATSVEQARHQVRHFAAGLGDDELVQRLELVVSELVTNAIVHGAGEFALRTTIDDRRVLVEVTDEHPGTPVLRHAGPEEPTGRGLSIVAAMADTWGVEPLDDDGKRVFAVFQLP